MKEDLISYETAVLAKEKGFEIIFPDAYYVFNEKNDKYVLRILSGKRNVEDGECSAPTQSLLQKWLREEHDIYAYIDWANVNAVAYDAHADDIIYEEKFIFYDPQEYKDRIDILLQEALKLIEL